MNLEDAFLRDIAEHPDEDAPRLAYADWLQERGDPRGVFIAMQCGIHQDEERGTYREQLKKQQRLLLREHRERWLGDAAPFVFRYDFRRGFLDHLEIRADAITDLPAYLAALGE